MYLNYFLQGGSCYKYIFYMFTGILLINRNINDEKPFSLFIRTCVNIMFFCH